ncbi:hypothetical protein [Kitasatospora purpeofusca]|uniref:hypothetical protein n=1 Tax=Kitasatospora purpeofusca TaxID=67352 RepID=UPI003866D2D6
MTIALERPIATATVGDLMDHATAAMPAAFAVAAMRSRGLDAWPVVDHDGHAIGLLTA